MRVGQSRRRDANEKAIVAALKAVGATIVRLSTDGAPDLLVGFRGVNYLFEVKAAKGEIRASQKDFLNTWDGQACVVRTVNEALHAIGALSTRDFIAQVALHG